MYILKKDPSRGDSLSKRISSKNSINGIRVGGQAVIEGVMMRSSQSMAIAVRRQDGEIVVKRKRLNFFSERGIISKIPFLRGLISLISALILGIEALNFSANQAVGKEEDRNKAQMVFMFFIAICFGIIIFFIFPLFLTKGLITLLPSDFRNGIFFNLLDGIIRLVIFLLYLKMISLLKDIKRVFQYHGAEHKSIFAFESGEDLRPEKVKNFSYLHPRCGTSFLLIVMIVSIFIFTLIPNQLSLGYRIISRLLLIPLIAGISYEMIRYADRKRDNKGINYFIKPGLWLQRLTAQEPSEGQIEVAIRALNEVLNMERSFIKND